MARPAAPGCVESATAELLATRIAERRSRGNDVTVTASGPAGGDVLWTAGRDLPIAVLHDLRAPISSLRLVAETLGEGVFGPDDRQTIAEHLLLHIGSLERLVSALFEFARLQAGDLRWVLEPVALGNLIDEATRLLGVQAGAAEVSLVSRLPDGLLARAQPDRLRRVLLELLDNAIRCTPAGGTVMVRGERHRTAVELEVADSGAGIPARDRDRVFEPFFRGAASGDGNGAGLGLTICRTIVNALGGDIWIPESDRGTRVRLSLPRA